MAHRDRWNRRSKGGKRTVAAAGRHRPCTVPLVSSVQVAVAIPAFNEAGGLPGFLLEIDRALAPLVGDLRLIVVDDASTDGTSAAIRDVEPQLACSLETISNAGNQGHGPSLMTAYGRALEGKPDFVLQVDGDGQFHGSDLRRVLVLLSDEAHAVCGVRRFRQDPWFRMRMTGLLRSYAGGDIPLIAEMSLYGKFFEVPEHLFYRRMHEEASSAMKDNKDVMAFFDPKRREKIFLRHWVHLGAHYRSVWRAPLNLGEKLTLSGYLLKQLKWSHEVYSEELSQAARQFLRRATHSS